MKAAMRATWDGTPLACPAFSARRFPSHGRWRREEFVRDACFRFFVGGRAGTQQKNLFWQPVQRILSLEEIPESDQGHPCSALIDLTRFGRDAEPALGQQEGLPSRNLPV